MHSQPLLAWAACSYFVSPGASSEGVWRLAEAVDELPLGAEITLRGNELLAGNRGVAFSDRGAPFHIELVTGHELEAFLQRRRPAAASAVSVTSPDLCENGRFLLNDPRVGLFHNQRISAQTAVNVALALDRILVLPGFFKFPHPDAWDGTEWVSTRRLFNWSKLQECYPQVIEIEDLLQRCGSEVLDNHVTVPFETMWMRSSTKAPWINGTRPHLRWGPDAQGRTVVLESVRSQPEFSLNLLNNFGLVLQRFLAPGFAAARTIRSHGLISNVTSLGGPVCFFPNDDVFSIASGIVSKWANDVSYSPPRWLGLHLRLFKRSTNTSGGYLQQELAAMQENLCNMSPEEFTLIVREALRVSFLGFTPTHTFIASNEAKTSMLAHYVAGFPGPRMNPYTAAHYDLATTSEECAEALTGVLVDAVLCAQAAYFIGNACSTMSEYIYQMRIALGQPITTSLLLAGVQHAHLLQEARNIVKAMGPLERVIA